MEYFIWNFIGIILIHKFLFISTNYLFNELNGNLIHNKGINFSIYLETLKGILVYTYDSNNKLLIEIEQENNHLILILKFNKFYRKENFENLCGCRNCSNIYMTFVLLLDKSQIITFCKSIKKIVNINNQVLTDQFTKYPNSKSHNKSADITFIWMGNIGPFHGYDGNIYRALTNQLFGCLDKFYFHNQLISFNKTGEKLLNSCLLEINESKCYRDNCSSQQISYQIFNCSSLLITTKYCRKKLSNYNQSKSIYDNKDNKTLKFLRMEWKQSNLTNYCLTEMKFVEEEFVSIYINLQNEIIIRINETKYKLFEISNTINHILLIDYNNENLTIKISNGTNIKIFSETFISKLLSIIIGNFNNSGECIIFEGEIDIEYELIMHSNTISYIIIYPIISLIFLTVIIFVTICRIKSLIIRTFFKIPSVNDYEFEETRFNVNINAEFYLNENDYEQNHVDENIDADKEVYEIFL